MYKQKNIITNVPVININSAPKADTNATVVLIIKKILDFNCTNIRDTKNNYFERLITKTIVNITAIKMAAYLIYF